MFATAAHVSKAYSRLAVESAALGADAHQLVGMLFTGAITAIGQARAALARGDIGAKAIASSKAIRLVDEGLKLYDYCARRLLHAQVKHDDRAYAEVAALLSELESAWVAISPNGGAPLRRVS